MRKMFLAVFSPSLLFMLWRLPITTFLANFAPVLREIQDVDVE